MALIRILGATALALTLSPAPLSAQISDNLVKIGVLTDLNGPASTPTGQGSVTAAQMAVEDFGGQVLGKPITVISADHQLKPDKRHPPDPPSRPPLRPKGAERLGRQVHPRRQGAAADEPDREPRRYLDRSRCGKPRAQPVEEP